MLLDSFIGLPKDQVSSFFSKTHRVNETIKHLDRNDFLFGTFVGTLSVNIRRSLSKLKKYHDVQSVDLGLLEHSNSNLDILTENNEIGILVLLVNSYQLPVEYRDYNIEVSPIPSSNRMKCIAWQRHLVSEMNVNNIQGLSLGEIKQDIELSDVFLRGCKNLFFDISSLKTSEVDKSQSSYPTGLFVEEACQLMRFAGESEILKSCVISVNDTPSFQTSMTIATMLWYFMEGVNNRMQIHPSKSLTNFQKYIVTIPNSNATLHFYKSSINNKWWFKSLESENYFACSYKEYIHAAKGNIPNRLLSISK